MLCESSRKTQRGNFFGIITLFPPWSLWETVFPWKAFWQVWLKIFSEIFLLHDTMDFMIDIHCLMAQPSGEETFYIVGLYSLKTAPYFSQKSCKAPRCVACTLPSRQLDWIFAQIRRACWHWVDTERACAFLGSFSISHAAAEAHG